MTTQKWLLRIAKLGLITWLVANTGCFSLMKRAVNESSPTHEVYKQIRERAGVNQTIMLEQLVNQYAYQKVDSVSKLVKSGTVYTIRDYFIDYRDVQNYSKSTAPWIGVPISIGNLQTNVSKETTQEEVDRARCEIIGDCREVDPKPINWSPLLTWLENQYAFGLLPAFFLCLILGFQERIAFRLKQAPISALVYLVLWPVNFFILVRRTLLGIDREARMRMRKESVFLRLSRVEEEILHRALTGLSSDQGENEVRLTRFQLRYIVALFAVVLLRIAPSVAVVTVEAEDHPPDCIECQMSIEDESHQDDRWHSTYIWVCGIKDNVPLVCENIQWPRIYMQRLIGFGRNVEHVPLVGAILSVVLNLNPKHNENHTCRWSPIGFRVRQIPDYRHFTWR